MKHFIFYLLTLFVVAPLCAQWLQISGPFGGYNSCFAVSGTNLFVGTSSGVFRSNDNGTSWTEVNTGLTSTNVLALAVSGTNLFAGSSSYIPSENIDSIFLSTNNGASWTAASTPFTDFYQMVEIGTNLFAGTYSGVFRSTNNGTSWTEVKTNINATLLRVITRIC